MRIFGELLVVLGVFILIVGLFAGGIPAKITIITVAVCIILPGWWLWQRKKKVK